MVERLPPPRPIGRARELLNDGTDITHDDVRTIVIRVANAQLEQAAQIGGLAREVAKLGDRLRSSRRELHSLSSEVEDTKSFELRTLRARNKWVFGIMATVIAALIVALLLHVTGWKP